jgi:hypothetical protein
MSFRGKVAQQHLRKAWKAADNHDRVGALNEIDLALELLPEHSHY